MKSASGPAAGAGSAIARLYGAPLDEFVELRRTLAAERRSAGDVTGARDVLAAKKPSRMVWATNQVARRHPGVLRAAFDAHTVAAKAQSGGDAGTMRETTRAFRDRVADVVKRCAGILAEVGIAPPTPAQARRLGETLRAAMGEGGETRERLLSGCLAEDLEVDDLPGLEAGLREATARPPKGKDDHAGKARERERQREAERSREAQRAQEARDRAVAEARQSLAALEEEARQARIAARHADTSAARARAEADRAHQAVTIVEERLAGARKALGDLKGP